MDFARRLCWTTVLLPASVLRGDVSLVQSYSYLSYLDIKTVLGLYSSLSDRDVQDIFIEDIARGKKAHAVAQSIKLPQLIVNQDDIYSFFMGNVEANYITLGKTVEVIVTEEQFPHVDLGGKIALIRSADPGYDWIFSRGIRGLITMYGGANSHMAIRCAELGIPAVIEAGEESFSLWSQASMLEIDCALRKVRTIS